MPVESAFFIDFANFRYMVYKILPLQRNMNKPSEQHTANESREKNIKRCCAFPLRRLIDEPNQCQYCAEHQQHGIAVPLPPKNCKKWIVHCFSISRFPNFYHCKDVFRFREMEFTYGTESVR